jgi:hypothetical protein
VSYQIRGSVYHDANANSSFDVGELGIGDVWVKLMFGGVVVQALQADFDTGAYSFPVPDGAYAVIVDDNSLAVDTTPTAPVNWAFQNPASGSLPVVVSGADVTGQDFGLTYQFDLAADCECGYEDGLLTQRSITIDGDMSDWGAVFSDGDNVACDATDDSDRDYEVQSTGRNLLRVAVTFDATHFSMFTERVGSSANNQTFVYYADTDNDGILKTGEPVVVAKWKGNTGDVTLELYAYDDLGSGGDPLLDGSGFADGYSMPGDLTFVKALPVADARGATTGPEAGTQMEWRVLWAELGVPPGNAIAWHVSSTNASAGGSGLGSQIDDNLGGCGGQCTGSNQLSCPEVSPTWPTWSATPATATTLSTSSRRATARGRPSPSRTTWTWARWARTSPESTLCSPTRTATVSSTQARSRPGAASTSWWRSSFPDRLRSALRS